MSKGKGKKKGQSSSRGQQAKRPPAPNVPAQLPATSGKPNMIATTPVLEHRFNDDLLISEHDQQLAKTEYREIYHVLDHPSLRDEFLRYDSVANSGKLWVQRIGLLAVLLATTALLSSALTPLVGLMPDAPTWISSALFYAEVGGVFGTVIAAGGLWIAGQKKKWLEARMMAEVLRLWHFQSLICRGKEIDASCNAANQSEPAAYRAARDRSFKAFMREWDGTLDSHLTKLIESPEAGYQLLHEEPTKYAPDSPAVEKVFSAYKSMRFRHQDNYATHKLQKTTSKPFRILKWPAAILQERTQALASFCLIGSLVCSFVIVVGHLMGTEFAHHLGWPAGIITLLILNVATRAVQDGLAAPEELQRYNDYAGKTRYLLQRFDDSRDVDEKLLMMGEMERAALEELKGFLRANFEARFIV
jgi:hypothetical protein